MLSIDLRAFEVDGCHIGCPTSSGRMLTEYEQEMVMAVPAFFAAGTVAAIGVSAGIGVGITGDGCSVATKLVATTVF